MFLPNTINNANALDCLKQLPDNSIDCSISSPPYWALRSYLKDEDPNKKYELGNEPFFKDYINNLIEIYKEVYRVLKPEGTCFVNLGETWYGGGKGDGETHKPRKQLTNIESNITSGKDFNHKEIHKSCMCNIPSRFAIKMTDELGFVQRNEIIWHKTNAMPQSMQNRFSHDYEKIFFFTKQPSKYFFEQQFEPLKEVSKQRAMRGVSKNNKYASGEGLPKGVHANTMSQGREFVGYENMEQLIAEGKTILNPNGRNMRSVWSISTKSNKFAHFAMYPEDLVERILKAGCPEFVCNKCGKARKKITKRTAASSKECPKTQAAFEARGGEGIATGTVGKSGSGRINGHIELIGLTDCGCNEGFSKGIVLDPFMGGGTTAVVAKKLGLNYIGFEINQAYIDIAYVRLNEIK